MSALRNLSGKMTEEEYLAFERASEFKHEFVNGEVFAMAGASLNHNLITASIIAAFSNQLRDKGCRILPGDMRVYMPVSGDYTYPDVTVVCGEIKMTDETFDTLANPTLIVEVLSPATEIYDRTQKFQMYWQIPSLQSYVLVAQDQPRMEHFTRKDANEWLLTIAAGLDQQLDLPPLGCTLALADVYAQVDFTAE